MADEMPLCSRCKKPCESLGDYGPDPYVRAMSYGSEVDELQDEWICGNCRELLCGEI